MKRARLKHGRHGHTRRDGYCSPTYYSWYAMLLRCEHLDHAAYVRYGSKGIRICERWHAFENFLKDMGERPPGMSLDRFPNGAGNYELGNCRWATPIEQAQNRRTTKLSVSDVQEILGRLEHGEHEDSIAERFAVARQTVNDIRRGRSWWEVSPPFQGRPHGIKAVSPMRALKQFRLGDLVTWAACGSRRCGTVAEVVAAGERPRLAIDERIGCRLQESYVVTNEAGVHWPDFAQPRTGCALNRHLTIFGGVSAPP